VLVNSRPQFDESGQPMEPADNLANNILFTIARRAVR
jgi:hypothetical protein